MKSIEIRKSLEKFTGLELSVGTTTGSNPFIVVRTVGSRSFFPTSLREVAIARVYPNRVPSAECPASFGNIKVGSIALKANQWADVLAKLESPGYRLVSAVEAVLAEQKGANFSRAVNEMLVS